MNRIKDDQTGKFLQKSDQKRKVRSVRLTDSTWNYFQQLAKNKGITFADIIEQLAESNNTLDNPSNTLLDENELMRLRDVTLTKFIKAGMQSNTYKEAKKAFNYFINSILSK